VPGTRFLVLLVQPASEKAAARGSTAGYNHSAPGATIKHPSVRGTVTNVPSMPAHGANWRGPRHASSAALSRCCSENRPGAGVQVGTLRRSVQMSAAPRRIHLAQPSSLFSCTWVPSLGMRDCSANGLGLPLVLFLGDTGDCPSYILSHWTKLPNVSVLGGPGSFHP